jgi:outer membrane protein OmpA-like peptidoglycan-associated protein
VTTDVSNVSRALTNIYVATAGDIIRQNQENLGSRLKVARVIRLPLPECPKARIESKPSLRHFPVARKGWGCMLERQPQVLGGSVRKRVIFISFLVAWIGQAVAQTGAPASWSQKSERTQGGPEADLVVRTGDINNLGFGWPAGFDPFSGKSTPSHAYPWKPPAGEPEGTDRIMLGSGVTPQDVTSRPGDGYSRGTQRPDNAPQPVTIVVGELPAKIDGIVFQMFLDDFQAPVWHSRFQVSLNGTRIPSFEEAVNSLEQTGPIGKLVTLKLLPEYWPLLRGGTVKLLIDDPTTHAPDGYAIDFVRILVNPHPFKYSVSVAGSVVDADTHRPIPGANVSAALVSAASSAEGKFSLQGVPAGLVVANASAAGYDEGVKPLDLAEGSSGRADFQLHRHQEKAADLERAIAEKGSVAIYGIHFDTAKATLRPDSTPALEAILAVMNKKPDSRWIVAGHTDNQGAAGPNQKLSEERAASVVAWLTGHGIAASRLAPNGYGLTQPVADNSTASGRALNRRVEIAPVP